MSDDPRDDPRVEVDRYIVRPTGYENLAHSDKDHWCLTVVNGHAYGWSIRQGVTFDSYRAMNRKGQFIMEHHGSDANKSRRYPLDEALRLALKYVDQVKIMNFTAQEASDSIAARKQTDA